MRYIGIKNLNNIDTHLFAVILAYELNNIQYDIDIEKLFNFDGTTTNKSNTREILDRLEDEKKSLNNVYIESFTNSPKTILSQIINIEPKYFDYPFNEKICINLKTFETKKITSKTNNLINSNYLISMIIPKLENTDINNYSFTTFQNDWWMSLKEFLKYFGIFMCQSFLGQNIWIKSLIRNQNNQWDEFGITNGFKIYNDVRFESEENYILDNDGTIIELESGDEYEMTIEDKKIRFTINSKSIIKDMKKISKFLTTHLK